MTVLHYPCARLNSYLEIHRLVYISQFTPVSLSFINDSMLCKLEWHFRCFCFIILLSQRNPLSVTLTGLTNRAHSYHFWDVRQSEAVFLVSEFDVQIESNDNRHYLGKEKEMHLLSLQLNDAEIFICSQDEITHGHHRN